MTRSLGDSSMKEFVVGSPYTTETTLGDEDEFLIVACDGVRPLPPPFCSKPEADWCVPDVASALGRVRRSGGRRLGP